MLIADYASYIQEAFDPAFSLVVQDHKLLSLPILSFEATWLEDVLQSFSGWELKLFILSYVILVEARVNIILSKFVPVFSEKIVLQITFFRSHLSHDYWCRLRQRPTEWRLFRFSFFSYLLLWSQFSTTSCLRHFSAACCCLFLQWRFLFLQHRIVFINARLWVYHLHLCLVFLLFLDFDQAWDSFKIRVACLSEWFPGLNSY